MLDIATILKAFGETTRLRVLRLISSQELSVNELVETLDMPQSRISRHLAVLRRVGLAQIRREGNRIYYRMALDDVHPFCHATWQAICAHRPEDEFFPEDLARLKETLATREARSKEYFDVVLTEWDRIRRDYIEDPLSYLVVSSLIRPGAVAVDVGTGTGEILCWLAQVAGKVIGVDRSERMLEVSRQRVARNGLESIELVLGDAEDLPLDDCICDTAFSSMLLHHLGDPGQGVKEMARIVKPGGKVVISDLVKHDHDWAREIMADVWLGFTEEQIRQWLAAAGLTDITYASKAVPSPLEPDSPPKLRAFIATATRPQS